MIVGVSYTHSSVWSITRSKKTTSCLHLTINVHVCMGVMRINGIGASPQLWMCFFVFLFVCLFITAGEQVDNSQPSFDKLHLGDVWAYLCHNKCHFAVPPHLNLHFWACFRSVIKGERAVVINASHSIQSCPIPSHLTSSYPIPSYSVPSCPVPSNSLLSHSFSPSPSSPNSFSSIPYFQFPLKPHSKIDFYMGA